MPKEHRYTMLTQWKGNCGSGTSGYRAYSRDHELSAKGKRSIVLGSSDPAFRGDASRYNPEELLVGALSTCHMLWVLHLCADAGIIVTDYQDEAVGCMVQNVDGSGQFQSVSLHPQMTITDAVKVEQCIELHEKAHQMCFIARSVNFRVECHPTIIPSGQDA